MRILTTNPSDSAVSETSTASAASSAPSKAGVRQHKYSEDNQRACQHTDLTTHCAHTPNQEVFVDAQHSTNNSRNSWSTQKIALCALMSAASALFTLMLEFPIMPGIAWLKYDPSVVVALLGGVLFGPGMAVALSVIPYLVHFATATGIFGAIMASVACGSFCIPASLIYSKFPHAKGLVGAIILSSIICLACCIAANLLVTPLYTKAPLEAVFALILPLLLPFNIIKLVLNILIFAVIFKPAKRICRTLFPR